MSVSSSWSSAVVVAGMATVMVGCASASLDEPGPAPVDAGGGGVVDASPVIADAPPGPCVTTTTQLLVNPAFDTTPVGWTELPFNPMYPIVTTDDGIAEDTPTLKAWMAGYAEVSTDSLYQDVVVPASTTMLVMTGKYAVGTQDSATVVKDTATVQLTTPGGTMLAAVLSLDNTGATADWTAINVTIPTAGIAGQTVRVMLRTQSDADLNTNFFYDSLGLTATHCQ